MTISDEVRETFKHTKIGTEFTAFEIKQMVNQQFGRAHGSIIPSDYCYNRLNNGIKFEKHLHLFEYTDDKKYRYLGLDYPFCGKILHKCKGGFEVVVGELVNGVLISYNSTEMFVASKDIKEKSNDGYTHTTKREVPAGLRYKVMKRDNFKCCICGSSSAKDPSVELHIDHIIPYSKGGETTIDNLQTLCSKCNLGKSDIL